MPQRAFWTERHPCRVVLTFALDPAALDDTAQATLRVEDQAGAAMAWAGASCPPGYGALAFVDAVESAMEAFESSSPENAKVAFLRRLKEWRRDYRLMEQRHLS